jgi:hypothetical protein
MGESKEKPKLKPSLKLDRLPIFSMPTSLPVSDEQTDPFVTQMLWRLGVGNLHHLYPEPATDHTPL